MSDSVRVYELAKELGISSQEALARLSALGVPATSASSAVPRAAAARLVPVRSDGVPGGEGPRPEAERAAQDAESLVRQAFESARAAGREDWRTMTVAVLKNRLLDLTGRSFRERDYGARNMREFVGLLPGALALDDRAAPPRVTLLDADAAAVAAAVPALGTAGRVRPDLWRAVLDTAGAGQWVLQEGRAARRSPEGDQDGPVLPTASPDELLAWRRSFAERATAELGGDVDADALRWWAGHRAPSSHLAPHVRQAWNAELRQRVVDRLVEWFGAQAMPIPPDLLVRDDAEAAPAPGPRADDSQRLRDFVLRCVREMSPAELAALPIPAAVAARAAVRA